MEIKSIKSQVEEIIVDGFPCRIRQCDDEVYVRYNISNLKLYNITYAEMVDEIIARLNVITERLMLERGISYNNIEIPDRLDAGMCYIVQL